MSNHNELIGKTFNRLTVLSLHEKGRNAKYVVKCQCGTTKIVYKKAITSGDTKSCGCLKRETNIERGSGETSFNKVFWTYQNNARKRKLSFNLTKEQVKNLTQMNCFYCDISPNQISSTTKDQPDYLYNGIDRKDNSIGYELNNCVPCCSICNSAKSNLQLEEFKQWVNRVYKCINR